MGYWSFGLAWTVCGLAGLTPEERRDGIDGDRLALVADYPRRAALGGGRFYAANDASDASDAKAWHPGLAPWLAAETGNAWLDAAARSGGVQTWQLRLPTFLLQMAAIEAGALDPRGDAAPPEPPATSWLPDQQAALWHRGDWTVTFAGGHNAEQHNHNDLGHLNVYLRGEPVLVDLGAPVYVSDFFGPSRYDYLPAGSHGHSVPIVNGQHQRVGRDAAAIVVDRGDDHLTLDLTAAYPPEARLASWRRTVRVSAVGVTVEDVATFDGEATCRLWCLGDPGDHRVAVTYEGGDVADPLVVRAGDHRLRAYDADARLVGLQRTLRGGEGVGLVTRIARA